MIVFIIILVLKLAVELTCQDVWCSKVITSCNNYKTIFFKWILNGTDYAKSHDDSAIKCTQLGFKMIRYQDIITTCNIAYSCS